MTKTTTIKPLTLNCCSLPAINNPWHKIVYKSLSTLLAATHEFYRIQNIDPIIMPITCGSVSSPMGLGSDSTPVSIKLFDKTVYLADSMQFQLEYLLRNSMKGVYYVMPTFRGEDHSKRHLNQFFHSELEMYGELEDVIQMAESYIKFLAKFVLTELHQDFVNSGLEVEHIQKLCEQKKQIPRIKFQDIAKMIGNDEENFEVVDSERQLVTLSHFGEKALMKEMGGCCWVTHYPKHVVPFYQAQDGDSDFALCADLLLGIGEVLGCGQRSATLEETLISLDEHQVSPSDYQWYLDLKSQTPIVTSGFGLGLERFILWLLRHDDIRDVQLFNRLKGQESMP